MTEYLFLLGNHPDLSYIELTNVVRQVWSKAELARESKYWASLELSTDSDSEISVVQARLGGVVKVIKRVGQMSDLDIAEISQLVEKGLPKKIKFTLLWFMGGPSTFERTGYHHELKEYLSAGGRKVQYTTKPSSTSCAHLSSNFYEWWVRPVENKYLIYQTVAWQDINVWSRRDRARPYSMGESGMLPLKVARMMINIVSRTEPKNTQLVYDPFCGTGSVLMEAGVLGYAVVGSDLSAKQVNGCRRNLDWLTGEIQTGFSYNVFTHDSTQSTQQIQPGSVELVVTEPYLGPAYTGSRAEVLLKGHRVSRGKIVRVANGLNKLYLGSLKQISHYLVSGGRLAIVIPEIAGVKIGDKLVDSFETLGYTQLTERQAYNRPDAVVKRYIYFLEKN